MKRSASFQTNLFRLEYLNLENLYNAKIENQ